jgi:diguanylate cyclase (GGDEF)-like protein
VRNESAAKCQNRHYLYFLDSQLLLRPPRTYRIGRAPGSDVRLPESTVSRRHAEFQWTGAGYAIRDLGSRNGVFVNSQRVDERVLYDEDRISVGRLNLVYRVVDGDRKMPSADALVSDTLMLESQVAKLVKEVDDQGLVDRIFALKGAMNRHKMRLFDLANKDPLMGTHNRRFFDESMRREVERARRYSRNLCLLMMDIDHFKSVNDTHGHQKGDDVLRAVAAIVMENTRSNDLVARYGGEEIAVILPETGVDQAAVVAEKIRRRVEQETEARGGIAVTTSIGIAYYGPTTAIVEALVAKADAALYVAKHRGRNRTVTQRP